MDLGNNALLKPGNTLYLKDIPLGTSVFNIEARPGDGGKFVRSGGCFAKIIAKQDNEVVLLLPSKKQKAFHKDVGQQLEQLPASGRKEKPFLKARTTRYFYMKARNKLYPRVKGQSMNAVDHPHGTSRSSKKGQPTIAPKNASTRSKGRKAET